MVNSILIRDLGNTFEYFHSQNESVIVPFFKIPYLLSIYSLIRLQKAFGDVQPFFDRWLMLLYKIILG